MSSDKDPATCAVCGAPGFTTVYGNKFSVRPGETVLCTLHDGMSLAAVNAAVEGRTS